MLSTLINPYLYMFLPYDTFSPLEADNLSVPKQVKGKFYATSNKKHKQQIISRHFSFGE